MNSILRKAGVVFTGCLVIVLVSGCRQKKYDEKSPPAYWHDHEREVRYTPDGEDFMIVNGKSRFTRAIYGTNTGFRFETSDYPEFGLYMPYLGGSAYLALCSKDTAIWVKDAEEIVSRYGKGVRRFTITDPILGKGKLEITALALSDGDGFVVRSYAERIADGIKLVWIYGGANNQRFSREGDIGADPDDCFYIKGNNARGNIFRLQGNTFVVYYGAGAKVMSMDEAYENASTKQIAKIEEGKKTVEPNRIAGVFPENATLRTADAMEVDNLPALLKSSATDAPLLIAECPVNSGQSQYFTLYNPKSREAFTYADLSGVFVKGQEYCEAIAGRVKIKTPDPYITPLGAVFSIAEDAVWQDPGYLHGAIGWRVPLTGWRAAYVADVLGFSDRARKHFDGYAASQVTDVPVIYPHQQEPASFLALAKKQWGTPMYSTGYICRNPNRNNEMHHYDMNLCYIDELLWHLNWTGDIDYAKKIFPVLQRHLAWEKQLHDPDGDGLYDAYCCIWASDDLQYNSGGVTHSSAYNYRGNKMTAEIAAKIGEDPAPYRQEAEKILSSVNRTLWLADKGHWAEYVDFMGHKSIHESAALWSVYHAIDSDIHDAFKAYQATRYVDTEIPHIPVRARGLEDDGLYMVSTTNWQPYSWSINNVAFAEIMHTTLAFWQSGRADEAFKMFKGTVMDAMYLGSGPANITQISYYDAARSETYRDFADPVAMVSRAMIQGMYGIIPDLMNKKLLVKPGFPSDWNEAQLKTGYIDYSFERKGKSDTYRFKLNMPVQPELTLNIRAAYDQVDEITVNGKKADWSLQSDAVEAPRILINAGMSGHVDIQIKWAGNPIAGRSIEMQAATNDIVMIPVRQAVSEIFDPQHVLENASVEKNSVSGNIIGRQGGRTLFARVTQGAMAWWMPVNMDIHPQTEIITIGEGDTLNFAVKNNMSKALNGKLNVNGNFVSDISIPANGQSAVFSVNTPHAVMGTNSVVIETSDDTYRLQTINWNIQNTAGRQYETVDMSRVFNDRLSRIFEYGKYLTPRSPYTTLQVPTQGVGFWCHPRDIHVIDDSGLSKAAGNENKFIMPQGIPFSTPSDLKAKNIAFTTMWDNYPDQLSIPLDGKASHLYLLMAGSTNHMQANFVNGTVKVAYKDGSEENLDLILPDTWISVEKDIYTDGYAFSRRTPAPWRVHLPTGNVSRTLANDLGEVKPDPFLIKGGAAIVLDLPLNSSKELALLSLQTVANEVVIGLMSATLVR